MITPKINKMTKVIKTTNRVSEVGFTNTSKVHLYNVKIYFIISICLRFLNKWIYYQLRVWNNGSPFGRLEILITSVIISILSLLYC